MLKRIVTIGMLLIAINGCSDGDVKPSLPDSDVDSVIPENTILSITFFDENPVAGIVDGDILLTLKAPYTSLSTANNYALRWQYENTSVGEDVVLTLADNNRLKIPANTELPNGTNGFEVLVWNKAGYSQDTVSLAFLDWHADIEIKGTGGHEQANWRYGEERPSLLVSQDPVDPNFCIMDNGLVAVIDMQNQRDEANYQGEGNVIDDEAYSPYRFLCDPPIQNNDAIEDDYGVFTYSSINDAFYYGNLTYEFFAETLGVIPTGDKLRLRVHYGSLYNSNAFWDGAYANFSDAYPFFYSTVSLDLVAHEIAHGVLIDLSELNPFKQSLSDDALTAHEAFADISAVMVKRYSALELPLWRHGFEIYAPERQLDNIITEWGAVPSYLDYEEAGDNYYKRIGLLSYPFYLLTTSLGFDQAYRIYVDASTDCWSSQMSLQDAAQCILLQVQDPEHQEAVIDAFKRVKIRLSDGGVMAHYKVTSAGFTITLQNNTYHQTEALSTRWVLGDGTVIVNQGENITHTYANSGEFTVTQTVTDGDGKTDTFSRLVIVEGNE